MVLGMGRKGVVVKASWDRWLWVCPLGLNSALGNFWPPESEGPQASSLSSSWWKIAVGQGILTPYHDRHGAQTWLHFGIQGALVDGKKSQQPTWKSSSRSPFRTGLPSSFPQPQLFLFLIWPGPGSDTVRSFYIFLVVSLAACWAAGRGGVLFSHPLLVPDKGPQWSYT